MRNTLTQWTGASITMFKNDLMPDIYGNAVSIHPGSETKIGIKKQVLESKFHKEPYISKCTDQWDKKIGNRAVGPYMPAQCSELAFQIPSLETCNCLLHEKVLNGMPELDPTTWNWCFSKEQIKCAEEVLVSIRNGTREPYLDCKPRCNSVIYQVCSIKQ